MLATILVAVGLGAATFGTVLALRRYFAEGGVIPSLSRLIETFEATVVRKRPKIHITGPRVKPVICQICLGRVKPGLEYLRCECGKAFHLACLSRTGFCPYCQGKYEDGERFTVLRAPAGEGSRASGGTKVNYILCPLCGSHVPAGAPSCQCGAIFVEEGGTFRCPECGNRVPEDESKCSNCGEQFDHCETQACPLCGRLLPAGQVVCACGTVIGNRCPECGHELAQGEESCTVCGAVFELI